MCDNDELVKEESFVKRGKNRRKIMKTLMNKTLMPREIAEITGIKNNNLYPNLKQLKDYGLVECINPEARKGRLYRLTEKGEKIVYKL